MPITTMRNSKNRPWPEEYERQDQAWLSLNEKHLVTPAIERLAGYRRKYQGGETELEAYELQLQKQYFPKLAGK